MIEQRRFSRDLALGRGTPKLTLNAWGKVEVFEIALTHAYNQTFNGIMLLVWQSI